MMMTNQIQRIDASQMDIKTFYSEFQEKSQPVILTNALSTWYTKQKTYSLSELSSIIGDVKLKNVFLSKNGRYKYFKLPQGEQVKERCSMTFSEFISTNTNEQRYLYGEEMPEILKSYFPPFSLLDKDMLTSAMLWACRNTGQVSPLHYDLVEGFLCQVYGSKQITLYSPNETQYLYPHVKDSPYDRQSSINDIHNIDISVYPNTVYAKSRQEGIINAGDILYIPYGWWHQVESKRENVSVTYRWNPYNNVLKSLAIASHGMLMFPLEIREKILSESLNESDLPLHIKNILHETMYAATTTTTTTTTD